MLPPSAIRPGGDAIVAGEHPSADSCSPPARRAAPRTSGRPARQPLPERGRGAGKSAARTANPLPRWRRRRKRLPCRHDRTHQLPHHRRSRRQRANGALDGFLAKLDGATGGVLFSTYLGGSGYDYVRGLAVDGLGRALLSGSTEPTDFPQVDPIAARAALSTPSSAASPRAARPSISPPTRRPFLRRFRRRGARHFEQCLPGAGRHRSE